MTRHRRLQRITDLAEFKRRQATVQAAQSRRDQIEQENQLEQFRAYRDEYGKSLAQSRQTMNAATLREVRHFMDQLEQTIGALERQAANNEARTQADLQQWRVETRRAETLGGIRDRALAEDQRQDEQRAQRDADERSAQCKPNQF